MAKTYYYESGNSYSVIISYNPGKKYFCFLTASGTTGVDGAEPILSVLEYPYISAKDTHPPKIVYIYRLNNISEIVLEDDEDSTGYKFQFKNSSGDFVKFFQLLMIQIKK